VCDEDSHCLNRGHKLATGFWGYLDNWGDCPAGTDSRWFSLAPIRAIARYLLVAYVPGLAIWARLRSNPASLIDLVLYPSLLSILPFGWVALAAVALGTSLEVGACIAIAFFLVIGFSFGWNGQVSAASSDKIVPCLALLLSIVLLGLPFAANLFQAVAWDAPLHAAIVSRILDGFVPPDSPIMAGQPANYYWLCHFYSAVLMRIMGLSVYQVFAILNVHAFVLFFLAGYRMAGRLTTSVFGRISAAWMLVFGLNAFGWIIFLANGSASPDKWYSLVAPFAMVKGYSPSLGNIIHEFLDGIPFAMSFAFDIAWLDVLLASVDGGRRGILITGALVLATAFYLHPLSSVFLTAASFASVGIFLLINRTRKSEWAALTFDLGVVMFAAALVTMPYAWNILPAKTGAPIVNRSEPRLLEKRGLQHIGDCRLNWNNRGAGVVACLSSETACHSRSGIVRCDD
jgi:hypothetical protein